MTNMDIIWRVHKNNEQLQAKLIPFLPLEYKYKVVEYNLLEDSQIPLERKFYAEFHVQGICSKEQFYSFLDAISDLTSTSWNKSHRDISDLGAPRRIFRGERKCHMNVRKQISKITGEMSKDQTPGKNTECPSTIRFHINRHDRHTDEDCKEYHCVVRIDFNHNHRITASKVLHMRPVSEDTKLKLTKLFDEGYSASGAYHQHRENIKTQFPNNYVAMLANRSYSPDYPTVFRLSNEYLVKKYGRIDGPDSILRAIDHARLYNQKNPVDEPGKQMCFVHQRPDGHYIMGMVNDLQRRVHEVNTF